ncbi:hypothetical protein Vsou_09890 [Vulcanisaeta souniana JCM 11219]|uniref:Uncharacterized protein n=1 Tax=Vulcanisaeta souniana JCM 11219 TaxID=1293586 RepID=A0ABN6SQ29_9CREN|nr:hypothetical protein Vsou_09890 [Vulcanisaeta souniana JCM 11219]
MANLAYQNTGTNAWSPVLVNGIALNSLTILMKQLMRSAAPARRSNCISRFHVTGFNTRREGFIPMVLI